MPPAATHPGDVTDPGRPVIPLALDHPSGHGIARHRHRRAQFLYAVRGVMVVTTTEGTWVVPPQQAVWVPAGVDHQVDCVGPVSMRSLYVHSDVTSGLPDECSVVAVTPLLRELIVELVRRTDRETAGRVIEHLTAVVLDQLRELRATPLDLPLPHDSRIRGLAHALRADPSDARTLSEWARVAGASPRTLARLFVKETGMTFAGWRQRLRLQQAVARLGAGETVTSVALDLGYQSPSAFVAMFRRTLGAPPRRYFRDSARGPDGRDRPG